MRAEGYVSERGLMGLRENEAEAYHPTAEIFDKVLKCANPYRPTAADGLAYSGAKPKQRPSPR